MTKGRAVPEEALQESRWGGGARQGRGRAGSSPGNMLP